MRGARCAESSNNLITSYRTAVVPLPSSVDDRAGSRVMEQSKVLRRKSTGPSRLQSAVSLGDQAAVAAPAKLRKGSLPSVSSGSILRKQSTGSTTNLIPSHGRSVRLPSTTSTTASVTPAFRSLAGSYSARTVAAALDTDHKSINDAWQAICVRVLPLFNGEGLRGYVEDLNDLVTFVLSSFHLVLARIRLTTLSDSTHIERTFNRQSSRSTKAQRQADKAALVAGLILADLNELVSIGCLTLTLKLVPNADVDHLPDDLLLLRLNELWSFFWADVLPHLEACFWPLRTDDRLAQAAQHEDEQDYESLDIRRLGLIGFRDSLVLPHADRIAVLLERLHGSSRPPSRTNDDQPASDAQQHSQGRTSPIVHRVVESTSTTATVTPSPRPSRAESPEGDSTVAPEQLVRAAEPLQIARRRQMIAILASLQTNDTRQQEIDHLLFLMRYKSSDPNNNLVVSQPIWPSTPLAGEDASRYQVPPGQPVHRQSSNRERRSMASRRSETSDSLWTSSSEAQLTHQQQHQQQQQQPRRTVSLARGRSGTVDSNTLTFESEEADSASLSHDHHDHPDHRRPSSSRRAPQSPNEAGFDGNDANMMGQSETPRAFAQPPPVAAYARTPRYSNNPNNIDGQPNASSFSLPMSTLTSGSSSSNLKKPPSTKQGGSALRTRFLSKLPGISHLGAHGGHHHRADEQTDGRTPNSTPFGRLGARTAAGDDLLDSDSLSIATGHSAR